MTFNFGKLLFSRLPPDLRRRKIQVLFAAVFTGLLIASAVALVMFMVAKRNLY